MADLLFSVHERRIHCQKRLLYAAFLTDVVRSASDAIDALELFRSLLCGRSHGPHFVGFMAFDAHGGDTACHLRAGMLLEVFSTHRQMLLDKTTGTQMVPLWIDRNIQVLNKTHEEAKRICAALTKDRVHPTKVGLGAKEDTTQHILSVLGWEEPTFPRIRDCLYATANSFPQTSKGTSLEGLLCKEGSALDLKTSLSLVRQQSLFYPGNEWHAELSPFSSPQSPSSRTTSSTICSEIEVSPLETEWDLLDSKALVRFVVFSYVLSKYKKFYCFKDMVGARLYPEGAAALGYDLMEEHWNFTNSEYKKAKLERISLELRSLQTWLSDFSCAWLQSLSVRFSPAGSMARLVPSTIRRSAKGLTAVACYPGYLCLRNELSREEQTFVMIDRHFCLEGIHFNIFLADLTRLDHAQNDNTGSTRPFHSVDWKVSHIALRDLYTLPDQSRPHPVVMGNSIDGSSADYISRLSSHYTLNPIGTDVHADPQCEENAKHVQTFLDADHDRLALSFFAFHKGYSFPLTDTNDETKFIGSKMDDYYPGLRREWIASKEEIGKLGGGEESLKTFGWQHMFVDTKERLAYKLELWVKNQDLMPLSADVTVK